jgi:hypothetical protein
MNVSVRAFRRLRAVAVLLALCAAPLLPASAAHADNAIQIENQLTGNPASEWDISGAGDLTIQGFATDISVNHGDTVHFKIKTDANAYTIDIYRLGYYQGNGARKVASISPAVTLPQSQPPDLYDSATGLTDCGNWAESAHWDVPANAVSGIYLAKLTRTDTQGSSHIVFVVRNDESTSDLFFQTSDATWQAYNVYGGNSLYVGITSFPSGHAAKVSYNRPFITRNGGGGGGAAEDWLFNSEYPMVRWVEANGYDVTYTTDVDSDRRGNLMLQHKVFMSVGHDEYWSAGQRANVTAARNAGVNLGFFCGNGIYWKTRFEPSTDGSNTAYRTLVCYKEGTLGENACGIKCDPTVGVWTGLWRDGCTPTYAANDACLPENALSGQISWDGTQGAIQVPDTYKNLRFWRNTSVATLGSGQTATLGSNTLGYEWDWQQYDASYPSGRMQLSSTNLDGHTHHLSLYRHTSGALVFGAGTVQWTWGLDGNHDRGNDAPVLAMQQATVNLFADMNVQPGSLQPGLIAATASTDLEPPASAITSPLNGASLPSGTPVTIQGTANDVGGGVLVGVEVSVDGGATWNAASGTSSWTYAWTPSTQGSVTIESRGFDDSGNMEVPGSGETNANKITVTVTAPAPPTCPCTVYQPTDGPAPGNDSYNDGHGNELGMRFRTATDGYITGIRFYKSAANTGAHVGELYTNAGARLAQATFTGETASGWQEVSFAPPIAVTGGTTYVAAYFSPGGTYAATHGTFSSAVVNGPMRGLADGEDGPNGVYGYTSTPAFPTSSYLSSGYYVDAVFNTTVGPDVTPPTITAVSPTANAGAVSPIASVTATFSEAIDPTTVSGATFELRDPGNAVVPASVSYNVGARVATLTPTSALATVTTYTATVKGGATDPRIKDIAGNALAADMVWSFTTASPPPPPPNEGPGGPILVISAAANPFSRYYAEILRAEGLNEFTASDVSGVTATVLNNYDVAILGEMPLSGAQVTMLSDWVNAGGTLIAMRPDKQLATLLGLTDAASTLADKYLLVSGAGAGAGITPLSMQFHGVADAYTLNGATSLATLYSDASTATSHPAVTTRNVGSNGGRAIAFAYDLARSIVYTRQGNPAWAGQERDGISPKRSDDMYYGAAAGDPQPDWVDLSKVAIPQADEQQRLLANAIVTGNLHRKPLPRFWYFPKGKKAVVIMTGDNHGDYGMQPRFDIYNAQSPANCSVPDWECVRATGYEYVGSTFTNAQAVSYTSQGFEVGVHINTGCADWTPSDLETDFSTQLGQFTATFPGIPSPSTNRTHCIAFSDWSTEPETELAHGIRLDTNYYFWPPAWVNDRPGLFTGSGMPMRFAKLDGTIIDCYQAVTQMTDESGQSYPMTADSLIARAIGPRGYYGAFCANMHFDSSPHAGSDAIVASALANNVPVVSAKQMLDWLDGRNGSSFSGVSWTGNALSFTIAAATGSRNIQAMLPIAAAAGQLASLTRNNSALGYTTETIKGITYALFDGGAGNYVATYAADTTPPAISSVSATPHGDGTATIAWTTDELADSRVDYGTSSGALASNVSSPTLTLSHSMTLTGLASATTFYYRVTSADASSNSATQPPTQNAPLSFVTPGTPCAVDRTTADFTAGTIGAATYVSETVDGEVILKPQEGAEFSGSALPSGWTGATYGGGGSVVVSGGQLAVNGAYAATNNFYSAGHSVDFVATFDPTAGLQHVGFGNTLNENLWAIFSTGGGGSLEARCNNGSPIDLPISGSWLGAAHHFRIDWKADSVVFWIDGARVAAQAIVISSQMRPIAGYGPVGSNPLKVDWIRMTAYQTSGSFISRVFDGGGPTTWGAANWTSSVPSGTTLAMLARVGPTPVPDGSWSAFAAIPSSGSVIGASGRYLQYRADLTSADGSNTPELRDVTIYCTSTPDVTPPVITNVAEAPAGNGLSALITWTTDELANSRIDYGTSAGSLTSNLSNSTLVLSHSLTLAGLLPSTTYFYRVTSADAASNSATQPQSPAAPLTFTTSSVPCPSDQLAADFALGTLDAHTAISIVGDGEVILNPTSVAEFSGTTLPAGWQSSIWNTGGSAIVGGGNLTVEGARAATTASFGPGSSMEFVATFHAVSFEHVGFVTDFDSNPPWAIFSTASAGNAVYARVQGQSDVLVSAALLGSPHRYRIDWNANSIVFWVDGAQVATFNVSLGANMIAMASDFSVDGSVVTVDWLRVTPYQSPGSFTSRVFDQGATTTWGAATWSATTPAGTSVALFVRKGDTPVPDGTWTAFASVPSSGSIIGGASRYIQYRADLATSDVGQTPVLDGVALACASCAPVTAITDLAATRAATGGASGIIPIHVTFTPPGSGGTVEVYRAPFGGYPRYDDAGGALAATPSYPPGSPWVMTAVTASGQNDTPPSRDSWSYVAFAKSACGAVAGVSNRPQPALDYLLGDVSDGSTICSGDNQVSTLDLTLLGAHYGETLTGTEAWTCLDVGPTLDGGVNSRPLTDGQLEFEDLIIFGLNFGMVSGPVVAARRAVSARDEIVLEAPARVSAGDNFTVTLRMSGAGGIRGVAVQLAWDAAVVSPGVVTSGAMLESQGGLVLSPKPGRVDGVLLGRRDQGIAGDGILATMVFKARVDGDPGLSIASIRARDQANKPMAMDQEVVLPPTPTVTALARPTPNPSSGRATISFSLAASGDVDLSIYSVDGRRVANLVHENRAAGIYQVTWNGEGRDGTHIQPGIYYARLTTPQGRFSRALVLVR